MGRSGSRQTFEMLNFKVAQRNSGEFRYGGTETDSSIALFAKPVRCVAEAVPDIAWSLGQQI